MRLWFRDYTLEFLSSFSKNTMKETLGIEFTEIGNDFLKAKMPVDHRTKQESGILHGGASVTLAETLGSVAAWMTLNPELNTCVGLEINANHIRSVKDGYVFGTANPLHVGKSTHIWEIKLVNDKDQLVCISRITIAILDKKLN
jgi:1,4-dihydroxy-2-naphthoyl-CoA hydrolase